MNQKSLDKEQEEFISTAAKDLESIHDDSTVEQYMIRTMHLYTTLTGLSAILGKVHTIVEDLNFPDTDEAIEEEADDLLDLFGSIAEDIAMPQSDITIDDEGDKDEPPKGKRKKGTK